MKFVFTEANIGTVKSVTIVGGEKSKGYGFVEMDNHESAKKVILELQGLVVDDHALQLKIAQNTLSHADRKKREAKLK